MIATIYNYLKPRVTRTFLWSGLAFILFVNVIIFPLSPGWFGIDAYLDTILDVNFSYSLKKVLVAFTLFGKEGRVFYQFSTALIDTPYAIIYTLFYTGLLVRLLEMNKWESKKWLILVPLIIGVADLAENTSIIVMLNQFPLVKPSWVTFSSTMTSIKWLGAVSLLLIFVFLFIRSKRMAN